MKTIEKAIIEVLKGVYKNPEQIEIKSEHNLFNDLGLDSLDKVEAVMALEDTFNVKIFDADALKWETVQDVIDYAVENNLKC